MRAGLPRLSLRAVFMLAIGCLGILATATLSWLASRETGQRLRYEIGADLAELATHMANRLDQGMFERWRDIQVVASLDTMRDPSLPLEAKRAIIERLRQTYPDYAAIALMSPEGRVTTATISQMAGANVADRDFFREGLKGPFVGDVHDAILLAKVLGNDPANPPRFVDVSAPVHAPDGAVVGVIGAHVYWTWAGEMERALRRAAQVRYPDIDVFVLARDGTVLLGPRDLLGTTLAITGASDVQAGRYGSLLERWSDGREYLTGYRRTSGYRGYPGLGWSVLVRQRAETAFAPVGTVQRRIALWGGLVALAIALLGWLAAGLITGPLRALAGSARALGRGEAVALPNLALAPREVAQVGDALTGAATELAEEKRRQTLLINELNHRVKNTLATVQAMAAMTARSSPEPRAYKQALTARIIALSKTHDMLTQASWEAISLRDLLHSELAPYDDGSGQRVLLEGPSVALTPRVAVALGMAAHELATNAAKHGSFSVPEGCVRVQWSLDAQGGGESRLHLVWKETGGPPITLGPARQGFGARLLREGITRELGGETHLDFAVEGVNCTLLLSLDEARDKSGAAARWSPSSERATRI